MADLSFEYKKSENLEEAFKNVKCYVTPENIKKFKVNADISYELDNKKMVATGRGFTLNLHFDDSKVDLELKLSFLLKPLRKTILKQMQKEIAGLV